MGLGVIVLLYITVYEKIVENWEPSEFYQTEVDEEQVENIIGDIVFDNVKLGREVSIKAVFKDSFSKQNLAEMEIRPPPCNTSS